MRHVSLERRVRDLPADAGVVQLLSLIDFAPAGDAAGMEVRDVGDILADSRTDVARSHRVSSEIAPKHQRATDCLMRTLSGASAF